MKLFLSLITVLMFGFTNLLTATGVPNKQKTILITGGAEGIGLACALKFQQQGWSVWAGSRTPPEGAVTLPGLHYIQLDVTDPVLIQQAIDTIMQETGRIDVLINNASYGLIGCAESVTIEEAKEVFDVNFFGALRMVQAVLPIMREQQEGTVVMMSSTLGVTSCPGLDLYASSKFALEGLAEALVAEMSFWNIKVHLIEPLFVRTDWLKHCKVGSKETNNSYYPLASERVQTLLAECSKFGQSPHIVAEKIYQVITNDGTDFRTQTSKTAHNFVASKLLDPTGNLCIKEQEAFFLKLISPR